MKNKLFRDPFVVTKLIFIIAVSPESVKHLLKNKTYLQSLSEGRICQWSLPMGMLPPSAMSLLEKTSDKKWRKEHQLKDYLTLSIKELQSYLSRDTEWNKLPEVERYRMSCIFINAVNNVMNIQAEFAK